MSTTTVPPVSNALRDISACDCNGFSFVFYVGADKNVYYLKADTKKEGPNTKYKAEQVKIGGKAVTPSKPRISVNAYVWEQEKTNWIALYYLSPSKNGTTNYLNDAFAKVDDKGNLTWQKGNLIKNIIAVHEDSTLTATIEGEKGNDLKVFFITSDGEPGCAYWCGDEHGWAQHHIFEEVAAA